MNTNNTQGGKIARWVKAEQKPEYNRGVLVFIPEEDNHITSGMWDISNKWVLLDEYRVPECEVTHWTEMPDKPEGYEQEPLCPEMAQLLREKLKTASPTDPAPDGWREEFDIYMRANEDSCRLYYEVASDWYERKLDWYQNALEYRNSGMAMQDERISDLQSQLTQLREENERLNKLVNNMPR